MSGTTYYQRNKKVILNRAKDHYEINKEVLREREQKIKEYQRNYCEARRSAYIFFILYKNEKRIDLQ